MFRLAAFASLATCLAALLLIACGDDGTETTTSTTTPPQPRPTLAVSSGFPEIDQLLVAAIAKDDIELAALSGYQRMSCASQGSFLAPACRPQEDAGTEVEVLAASACEDGWVRPEEVPDAFRLALEPDTPELLAVYRPVYGDGTFGRGFGATSVAVFDTGSRDDGTPKGVALHIKEGRVVWIETDCPDLNELLDPARIESFIIEPPA